MNTETIRYKATNTGFIKHLKVTKENPRDFKVGDKYYFCWGGMSDTGECYSERETDELNGNVEEKKDSIDLVFNFWRCVRKVAE